MRMGGSLMQVYKKSCIALLALLMVAGFDARAYGAPRRPVRGDGHPVPATSIGRYRLHNHPNGPKGPPLYGLRLDGLLTLDHHDVFTFDFDAPESAMFMDLSATGIHIFGQAFGGLDRGRGYKAGSTGVFLIDFKYDSGVSALSRDRGIPDIAVTGGCSLSNSGTIQAMFGSNQTPIPLVAKCGRRGNSFRFGDKNGSGHRGFDGLSGWGRLNHNGLPHMKAGEFLFTAEKIPEPSSLALLCLGLPLLMSRRRAGNR